MIEINNLTTNPTDEEFLKKAAKKVLEGENEKEAGLSIVLVGQGRIRELNKKYRGKNRTTDVLAFPRSNVLLGKFKIEPAEETGGLGEIIICLKEIKKNSRKFGWNFEKELAQVLIHGVLHLLGYDHEKSEREAQKMKKKEELYFSQLKT